MGVGERLFKILKAAVESKRDDFREKPFFDHEDIFENETKAESNFHQKRTEAFHKKQSRSSYPWDPSHSPDEDLKNFNLSGGASWDEVKRGYRTECKKYHSDLYHNAPEKKEAAEEIMVIFNAAYGRLKRHYQKK